MFESLARTLGGCISQSHYPWIMGGFLLCALRNRRYRQQQQARKRWWLMDSRRAASYSSLPCFQQKNVHSPSTLHIVLLKSFLGHKLGSLPSHHGSCCPKMVMVRHCLKSTSYNLLYILYVCVLCLHACLCIPYMPDARRDQKRSLYPLKLELQMVVCLHAGARNQTRVLWKSSESS